ncbi:UDP-glucuronosyltransferase 2A1 [Oncorhynchus tshawytscha]|uniref:UDP-glucuronosyltransferase 2A1 n=1 Tax=Oncorhynchus tshawytscha TaxID=74940 RepID=UPI000D0A7499|nr:UDP-glucuronosyltransferase 2A1 [Oncorhynchus tshawytscha]
MKLTRHISVFVIAQLCIIGSVNCGNILVWNTEGSHWINLKPILETLIDRGHSVTVLVQSASVYMDPTEKARFSYEPFNVSISMQQMNDFFEEFIHFHMYEIDHLSYLQIHWKGYHIVKRDLKFSIQICDGLLRSETVMRRLREAKYDVLLSDPIYPCSDLVAEDLGIPLVYTLRFSIAHIWERLCGQLPSPPSFVPGAMIRLTDEMSFTERLLNFLFYASQDMMAYGYWQDIDAYYSEIRGKPSTYCEVMGQADLWLIRTYWDFDYPRPLLPNFKFVGGIHCKPAKPLPEDMEEFVQSSGDDGIVVFTLGSMIKNLTTEKGNMIASALGQIPQKVLWRLSGEKPETLAPNTRVLDWIPQNDLLGHPKTRAFITHGGTNGIYEAIYHGVPMVGIPMFADQPDNMVHMKAKGAAVIMNFNTMKTQDLVDGLNTVINEPSYKENALRLSRIHHDRPISPKDEAVFWIEFTMRNKGAKHLRVQAHELTWYQYHSLDVFAFLLAIVMLLTLLFIKTCLFCVRRCCYGAKSKRKTE